MRGVGEVAVAEGVSFAEAVRLSVSRGQVEGGDASTFIYGLRRCNFYFYFGFGARPFFFLSSPRRKTIYLFDFSYFYLFLLFLLLNKKNKKSSHTPYYDIYLQQYYMYMVRTYYNVQPCATLSSTSIGVSRKWLYGPRLCQKTSGA